MNTQSIIKYALINAISTALYIVLIGVFFYFGPRALAGNGQDTVFIPIAMLSLFVFSAAVCGSLYLGRPVMWYLDGKKAEAVKLFLYTTAVFFVVVIVAFVVMYLFRPI